MRVVKTDRGYIDMDHVLAVGEPYYYGQGLYGFDVTMAFLDKSKQMLYHAEEVGLKFHQSTKGNSLDRILHRIRVEKIGPFVALWTGQEIPETVDPDNPTN
jgi:hypothetical protein